MDNLIAQVTERLSDCSLPSVMFSHNNETFEEKFDNFMGLAINYVTRKDFLQELEKPRKHLPVQRQQ